MDIYDEHRSKEGNVKENLEDVIKISKEISNESE
jgi:hypothetical protein